MRSARAIQLTSWGSRTSRCEDRRPTSRSTRNVAYAIVDLAFAMGGMFILVREGATPADRVAATGGIVFFGVGAVVMFLRARRG